MGLRGLSGKVAVVAGGASGLGAATAARLAQEGCRVAVGDVAVDASVEIAERTLELESLGARARALQDFLARYDRADSIQAELHELSTIRQADVASAIEAHLRRGRRVVIEAHPAPGAPKAGVWNVRRTGG